jgi:hypothetical protein
MYVAIVILVFIYFNTAQKEREQLGDRRNNGESNCNSGDGPGQMAQPSMFMMMMMIYFNGLRTTTYWLKKHGDTIIYVFIYVIQ